MLESQLKAAFAVLSEGIVFQNAAGQIVECNSAAERISGLTADQMKGKTSMDPDWYSVNEDGSPLPGEEHPAMVTLRTGLSIRNFVFGVGTRDRARRWISVNTDLVLGESGELEFVVACFVDITAQREQSRSLEVIVNASELGTWDWNIPSGRVQLIESDPVRLRQVLVNLIANAIKFTERGSVCIHVRVDQNLGELSIAVEDTGIGLTAEQIGKLFGAFELLFPQPFHLILSDIHMPEVDGYSLAKILLAKGSRLPMIALTAHAMSDELQKCLNAGFSAYASKPIDKDSLIAICHTWGKAAV